MILDNPTWTKTSYARRRKRSVTLTLLIAVAAVLDVFDNTHVRLKSNLLILAVCTIVPVAAFTYVWFALPCAWHAEKAPIEKAICQ